MAEEEQLLQEESRRREEDERLARMLSTQLVCGSGLCSETAQSWIQTQSWI